MSFVIKDVACQKCRIPQIRVWKKSVKGEKDFFVFDNFGDAISFIQEKKEHVAPNPTIAFGNFEFDLWKYEEGEKKTP